MPATLTQARDQMSTLFKTAVDTRNTGLDAALQLLVTWDDVAGNAVEPSPPTPWARFTIRHASGGQASLSGALGTKRYKRGGVIIVQVFTPGGAGSAVADELVAMILAAYEGKTTTGGLIFRHGRLAEIGQSGAYHQTNVTVDFEYDEIK